MTYVYQIGSHFMLRFHQTLHIQYFVHYANNFVIIIYIPWLHVLSEEQELYLFIRKEVRGHGTNFCAQLSVLTFRIY